MICNRCNHSFIDYKKWKKKFFFFPFRWKEGWMEWFSQIILNEQKIQYQFYWIFLFPVMHFAKTISSARRIQSYWKRLFFYQTGCIYCNWSDPAQRIFVFLTNDDYAVLVLCAPCPAGRAEPSQAGPGLMDGRKKYFHSLQIDNY